VDGRAEVIVVGLGAVGAAVLYQLARRGMSVLGIDRFHPPHDKGSSHGETRITRQSVSEGAEYVPFVLRSHALWREFEQRTGRTLFEQVGALFMAPAGRNVDAHGGHFVARALAIARDHNIEHERLDEAGIAERFPQFKISGRMIAYYEKGGGFLRPEACIAAQLDLAREEGAATEPGTTVAELVAEPDGGVRVVTDRGDFRAKRVVLAAGVWLPELAGGWYRRLKVTRQALFWFTVTAPPLWDKERSPIFIWADGMRAQDLFYGFPMAGPEARIKVASETDAPYTGDLLNVPPVEEAEKERIYRAHVAPRLNGVGRSCVEAKTCFYTEAPHYQFIVDRHPTIEAVTVVSACSGHGFKHSAALGEAIAEMISSERTEAKLAVFSLARLRQRAGA
jgi:sarcosine oxidase